MITLLQLYGYHTPTQFKTQFNKKMSCGVKQYMPPPTVNISNKRRIAYKTVGAKTMAPGWYGSSSENMNYPIKVYSNLIPSLGNQVFK